MKKQLTILSALLVVLSSFYFAGCTSTETVATTTAVVTNLRATSLANNQIGVRWTRDASDQGSNTLIVRNSAGIIQDSFSVAGSTGSSYTYNASANTEYTFSVRNDAGTSSSITWMAATRFGTEAAPIRIWEFSSKNNPSGIALKSGQTYSVGSNHPEAAPYVDFVLDDIAVSTDYPTGMTLESANILLSNMRQSYVRGDQVYVSGGLDNYYTTDFKNFMDSVSTLGNTKVGTEHPIEDVSGQGSRILTVETADNNLAKVEIVQQANGKLYGGTAPDRYVDLVISYNPTPNKPYASRPHAHNTKPVRIPVF